MGDRGPVSFCTERHGSNSTVDFHDCMCKYDYSFAKSRVKALKMQHCHKVADIHRMGNFYTYIVIGGVIIIALILLVAAICSFKWYLAIKKNPFSALCSLFCCCNKTKKQKKKQENDPVNVFEQSESGHTWSPVNLPPSREEGNENAQTVHSDNSIDHAVPSDDSRDPSICMNFCLSDPVQDCCEFFDCDIMWRKKSIYTIPIFGRKKQQNQQNRRPTRPAPLPPKAVVLPQVKTTDPVMFEDDECEPVPEAPPSPEPVRTLPAKAIYVDPLAFLQRTFVKNSQSERGETDESDGKQEALYSKFKNMVINKVKKSVSVASINKLGVSSDPNGAINKPVGSKKLKTGSLASLHNLGEDELDTSYGSKRSLSLASLNMLHEQGAATGGITMDPRSRISVLSTTSTAADDIPPCARKDEYIDLETMARRFEMKMHAAVAPQGVSAAPSPQPLCVPSPQVSPPVPQNSYTPNFMPASAFVGSVSLSSFNPNPPSATAPEPQRIVPVQNIPNDGRYYQHPNYFPPVPASQGKPAVPARTGGTPIYSMSPSGTLGRSKPVVPPRPPIGEAARTPASPHTSTMPRSPRLVKPSGPPPPPPPGAKIPIESSI